MAEGSFSAQKIAAMLRHSGIMQAHLAGQLQKYNLQQVKSSDDAKNMITFSPRTMMRKAEPMRQRARAGGGGKSDETKASKRAEKKGAIEAIEKIEEVSEEFSNRHDEFTQNDLLELRAHISKKDTKEEILQKVLKMYPDYSLADEALDFLIATTDGDLQKEIIAAKEELNKLHGREVRAGRNMGDEARAYSKQGLGTPSELRDVYRDITGNPRDAPTLFQELTTLYPFEKMVKVIEFTLHSIGKDLNAKGPSIARGELHRLMTECRSMQAIIGVYRFFKSQMGPIGSEFKRQGLTLPMRLTFETLSKHYVTFLQDRYPSAEKVFKLLDKLGVGEELFGQVPIMTKMRDACRKTAPKLFKSEQHRLDVLATFNEAISETDEKIEELEEEMEEVGEVEGSDVSDTDEIEGGEGIDFAQGEE